VNVVRLPGLQCGSNSSAVFVQVKEAAAVVPAVDEVLDCGDEVFDRGEAVAADGLRGDDREDDLRWSTAPSASAGMPGSMTTLGGPSLPCPARPDKGRSPSLRQREEQPRGTRRTPAPEKNKVSERTGVVHILAMARWLVHHGYLPARGGLWAIGYGWEICSNRRPAGDVHGQLIHAGCAQDSWLPLSRDHAHPSVPLAATSPPRRPYSHT
jgi:hypothetical protein